MDWLIHQIKDIGSLQYFGEVVQLVCFGWIDEVQAIKSISMVAYTNQYNWCDSAPNLNLCADALEWLIELIVHFEWNNRKGVHLRWWAQRLVSVIYWINSKLASTNNSTVIFQLGNYIRWLVKEIYQVNATIGKVFW